MNESITTVNRIEQYNKRLHKYLQPKDSSKLAVCIADSDTFHHISRGGSLDARFAVESTRNSCMKRAIAKKKTAAIKLVRDFFDGNGIYDMVNGVSVKWSLDDLDRALEVYND